MEDMDEKTGMWRVMKTGKKMTGDYYNEKESERDLRVE